MPLDDIHYLSSCQLGQGHDDEGNFLGWQRITTEVSEMPHELGPLCG